MFLTALNDTTRTRCARSMPAPSTTSASHSRSKKCMRGSGRTLIYGVLAVSSRTAIGNCAISKNCVTTWLTGVGHAADMGSPLTAALARLDVLKLTQDSLAQEYREDLMAIGAVHGTHAHDSRSARRAPTRSGTYASAARPATSRVSRRGSARIWAPWMSDRPLVIESSTPVELVAATSRSFDGSSKISSATGSNTHPMAVPCASRSPVNRMACEWK